LTGYLNTTVYKDITQKGLFNHVISVNKGHHAEQALTCEGIGQILTLLFFLLCCLCDVVLI